MVDPTIMCRQHLLGEHNECHMFAGTLASKKNIKGYINNGQLDPRLLQQRHDELAEEMLCRGWNHNSPLLVPDYSYLGLLPSNIIDIHTSQELLLSRCYKRSKRYTFLCLFV